MEFNDLRELLLNQSDENHRDYVKAILSIELKTEDQKKLDYLYDEYMETDIQLIDENIYDFESDYDNQEMQSEVNVD